MSEKKQDRLVESTTKGNLSRRDFIKGTALGAAGLIAGGVLSSSAMATEKTKSHIPEKWDYEADVVIVGAGATGLPAALRALDAGASVLVIDQNYDVGGRAIISGGATPPWRWDQGAKAPWRRRFS